MPFYRDAVSTDVWDLALIGGGAAGLTVLDALTQLPVRQPLKILVCDDRTPLKDQEHDRTWCFWDKSDNSVDQAVTKEWSRLRVASAHHDRLVRTKPYRYALMTSDSYYRLVNERLELAPHLDVVWTGHVRDVQPGEKTSRVCVDGASFDVPAVLDSRPRTVWPDHEVLLWQHFYGVFVESQVDVFDPSTATLMDFAVSQPQAGTAFGYVLPVSKRRALIEYTEFSPTLLTDAQYRAAWAGYVHDRVGVSVESLTVVAEETGCIPMTDARLEDCRGSYRRIGTAGGATRASTGYTFRAMQRCGQAIAEDLVHGRSVNQDPHYDRRYEAMDALMLKALADGRISGAGFFDRLFARNSASRVLSYLDGDSRRTDDVALMSSSPTAPMVATVVSKSLRRVRGISQ